jgi:MFS family permease
VYVVPYLVQCQVLMPFRSTINMLVSAVMKPVYARVSDMTSRPTALASGLFFFTIGYIVVAASQSVKNLAGGEVLYTVGNTGMSFGES